MVDHEMVLLLKQYKYEFVKTSLGTMRVFVSRGRKPDNIVLVHGLIVSSSFMRPTAKELAKKHKVFVPDLLGHGKSEVPEKFLTIDDHASSLKEALDRMHVTNPIVVGGSYGCQVAVELAHRVDVRGLVFVGPNPGGDALSGICELAMDGLREPPALVLRVLREFAHLGVERCMALLEDMSKYPFQEKLRAITAPTLVITGEHDPFFSPDFLDETAHSLKHSRSICMPDMAHGLPFTEAEQISKFVESFMDDNVMPERISSPPVRECS